MRTLLACLALAAMLVSCTRHKTQQAAAPVDTIPMMVMQIQKCSRLYTTEYKVHKIVTHDDKMKLNGTFLQKDFSIDLPLGKRKIAIPIDATLKAYVDFKDFSADNVRKRGSQIEIVLPDPKVTLTSTKIDHEAVKQYVALTRSNFTDEELTAYERKGRKAILADIPQMGIIENARESAAHTLVPLIVQMGYKEADITVTFRKELTPADIRTQLDPPTVEHGKARK